MTYREIFHARLYELYKNNKSRETFNFIDCRMKQKFPNLNIIFECIYESSSKRDQIIFQISTERVQELTIVCLWFVITLIYAFEWCIECMYRRTPRCNRPTNARNTNERLDLLVLYTRIPLISAGDLIKCHISHIIYLYHIWRCRNKSKMFSCSQK